MSGFICGSINQLFSLPVNNIYNNYVLNIIYVKNLQFAYYK